uniref:PiggyBac transposable element-derived protein domain-containing protein n=1 Tax=Lepisosteus oculatus TaxID=7918 RepID=W5MSZ2_LEPOC
PRTYFSNFFDNEIFELIADQTNLYSCQLIGGRINTNISEIKAFIGIKLFMGVVKMPAMEDYWASDTRYDKIADVMPIKHFKCLSRMLHFQNNLVPESQEDRLVNIRPVIDHMRTKCSQIESENQFSIDEMMVPYKEYLPAKPEKWGFKIFLRARVSGFVYDFFVYMGKSTFDGATQIPLKEFGLGANVVLHLCKTIRNPPDCVVYFDNFFTSLDSMGLRSLGTIRKNRLMGCKLEDDRELLKRGRGSFDYRVNDAQLAIVKWADSKTVTLVSTCASVMPVGEVKRFSKKKGKQISVPCPQIVAEYNHHMGGVDLADMMIALYHTPAKSHRWYLCIFWQLIDIAVNNAWLLYRHDAAAIGPVKLKKLKAFRLDVAKGLIYPEKQKRGRPSLGNENDAPPIDEMCYDGNSHYPVLSVKGRCRMCPDGQTSIRCEKCNVRLCIVTGQNARNCLRSFH